MHANTVWLFIKKANFFWLLQWLNTWLYLLYNKCTVLQLSTVTPGFPLGTFSSAFPLFLCFFLEWDGYIVNGFFFVLTVSIALGSGSVFWPPARLKLLYFWRTKIDSVHVLSRASAKMQLNHHWISITVCLLFILLIIHFIGGPLLVTFASRL